jgi:hypothetical protein
MLWVRSSDVNDRGAGDVPAWSQLAARSLYGLSSILAAHGGRSWDLEKLVVRGGMRDEEREP